MKHDDICHNCEAGWILPSGVCDHCNCSRHTRILGVFWGKFFWRITRVAFPTPQYRVETSLRLWGAYQISLWRAVRSWLYYFLSLDRIRFRW